MRFLTRDPSGFLTAFPMRIPTEFLTKFPAGFPTGIMMTFPMGFLTRFLAEFHSQWGEISKEISNETADGITRFPTKLPRRFQVKCLKAFGG